MAFEPPAVRPTYIRDYRVPAVATEADIPAFLDWLRVQPEYKGGRVVGVLLQTRDTGALYRVTSQPALGIPGTLEGYGLDRTPSGASVQGAMDTLLAGAEGFADLTAMVQPALDELDAATALASASIGVKGVRTASHLALPTAAGTYRVLLRPALGSNLPDEAGQVWERHADASLTRVEGLETVSQTTLDARLVADTVASYRLAPGRKRGDTKQYLGRTYWWDDLRVNADDGVTILTPAGTPAMGRWVLTDREWGLNLKWFEYLVVDGCWMAALTYALSLDDVYVPSGVFLLKPSSTNQVLFPVGVRRTLSGSGPSSTLKVMDGTGTYGALISQTDVTQAVTDISIRRLRIDQNADNVAGAVISADVATAQNAIRFGAFAGVTIDLVHFNLATGINTVYLGYPGSTDATMTGCTVRWGRNLAQADYDNSAFYLHCTGQQISGNVFRARSVADRARGAIETHGSVSVVDGNTIINFREGINIVPVSPGITDPATASLTVINNVIDGCSIGVRFWPITGKVLRNVRASGNTITLNPAQWPEFRDTGGVMMAYSISGALDGDVDGLRIEHNDVTYPPTDTRTDYAYSSCAGIGLNGNGNYKNVAINHNRIKNAPMWALVLGRAGKTLAGLQAYSNEIINPGTATGQSPSASRVAVSLSGLITNAVIGNLRVSEDTATAQAFGFMTTGLTAGSSVEFQAVRTDAPNNPALAFPTTLPAGVTHKRLIDFTVPNIFTGKQSFITTGTRAVEAISDSVAVYASSTGANPAMIGVGNASYGGQFFSRDTSALVAQQQGTLTGTLGSAGMTALVQRQSAAGANNITGTTFVVDDAATVTTGTRFNALADLRWDGVTKLSVSGASHAMGAGIITTGGWARASATLDFPSIAAGGTAELTISVPGALVGDGVEGGPPAGLEAGLMVGNPRVTATGIVTIRVHNTTAAAIDPAAATYTVKVMK